MIDKIGISGIGQKHQKNTSSSLPNNIFVGRVKDIILDKNHPQFENLGNYQSIGTVIYEIVGSTNIGIATKTAKPAFPNIKSYPLVGELIIIIIAPSSIQESADFIPTHYYLTNINLWNTPHHNALPNPRIDGEEILNSSKNQSQQTFIEKDNIHPLLPFNGDVIHEGRFGQSLRFGNTSNNQLNNWSSVGNNSEPITILRNGQSPNIEKEGWIHITEDINKDLSSIYLTSTQKIPFNNETINRFTKFNSLGKSTTLNNYFNPQIILNSDRIIINAKSDSILIGARKSIDLSTGEYINVQSKNLYVDARNIKLGDEKATESLILGDSFMKDFKLLLDSLNNLCSVLEFDQSWPGGVPSPNTPVNTAASALKAQINNINSKIQTSKFISKISKTI